MNFLVINDKISQLKNKSEIGKLKSKYKVHKNKKEINLIMKKKYMTAVASAVLSLSMSMTSFAAWHDNGYGWWYDKGDSTYPKSMWQWIDSDGDGTAECYCFNNMGYRYENTTTPDGYTVNRNGAWTVDGIVQTKSIALAEVSIDRSVEGTYRNNDTGETAVVAVNEDGSINLTAECNGYVTEQGPLVDIGDHDYTDRWGFSCVIRENTLSFVADGEHIYHKQ